ncbi:unnamed protein product [Acanthosepion pharaonis]|uniref:Uncharacterized protein n=1 Tax=Acanthosepion pharaonis TaxID=158019 RepID=A0A812D2K4_ACAPH|nr:unnamed protein product [Sepia pharaonis]
MSAEFPNLVHILSLSFFFSLLSFIHCFLHSVYFSFLFSFFIYLFTSFIDSLFHSFFFISLLSFIPYFLLAFFFLSCFFFHSSFTSYHLLSFFSLSSFFSFFIYFVISFFFIFLCFSPHIMSYSHFFLLSPLSLRFYSILLLSIFIPVLTHYQSHPVSFPIHFSPFFMQHHQQFSTLIAERFKRRL